MDWNQNQSGQNVYGQSVYGQNGQDAYNQNMQDFYQANANMQYQAYQAGGYGEQAYYGAGQPQGVMQTVSAALQQEVVAKSFIYMVAALVVTAISAYATRDILLEMLTRNFSTLYYIFGAEFIIVLASNAALKKNNVALSAILFTLYSFLTGSTLGVIFYAYTDASIGATFLMTAGMFGFMAIYGLVTEKDLTSIGSICLMGLVGLIIATLVNMILLKSDMFDLIVSVIGIVIFVGLTAYDTQKIKQNVAYANTQNTATLALGGAFELYLDFINIFLRLLRFMGRRK